MDISLQKSAYFLSFINNFCLVCVFCGELFRRYSQHLADTWPTLSRHLADTRRTKDEQRTKDEGMMDNPLRYNFLYCYPFLLYNNIKSIGKNLSLVQCTLRFSWSALILYKRYPHDMARHSRYAEMPQEYVELVCQVWSTHA